MSINQNTNPINYQKKLVTKISKNNNIVPGSKNLINKSKIITTTKTKKIIISEKSSNFQGSPTRILNAKKIYNISPQIIKAEEVEENNNNTFSNIYINKTNNNNIIYNKEDFNNNNFYANKNKNIYNEKTSEINTISFDLKTSKKLLNYNHSYISPKKNSKILLKSVYCSPVSVKYTEIKDAELRIRKEYNEQTEIKEETEINIKNKIIKIWDDANECISEYNFSLINDNYNNEKDYLIESYEKKINELNETITILKNEKEYNNNNNEFIPWNEINQIQNINNMVFSSEIFNLKSNNQSLFISNINNIFIPPKDKFQNIKDNTNSFYILKISKDINYISTKENDIYIPKIKKQKFTSDTFYGQELCILAKKKKKIYNIEHKDKIILSEKKYKPNKMQRTCIVQLYEKQIILEQGELNSILIPEIDKPENTIDTGFYLEILKEPLKKKIFFIESIDNIYYGGEGITMPEYVIEIVNSFDILINIKRTYIMEQNANLFIESTPKNFELDIEYGEEIFLEEILKQENSIDYNLSFVIYKNPKPKYFIQKQKELYIIGENKYILESTFVDEFIIEGLEALNNDIEKEKKLSEFIKINNDQIEILRAIKNKAFNSNEIEKIEDINLYPEIKNEYFDIIIGDNILLEEIQKPEYEISESENFIIFNDKNKIKSKRKKFDKEETIISKYEKSNFKSENNIIEDTVNFQIISLSIRELYQQKLQGFSIFKKEKESHIMQRNNYFSIYTKNYNNDIIDINTSTNISHNKYQNVDYNIYKQYEKTRKSYKNKTFYKSASKFRKINTIKSKNYKTFIAFPCNEIEYINNIDIINKNLNSDNIYYYSDDEFLRGKKFIKKFKKNIKTKNENNNYNNKISNNKQIIYNKQNIYENNKYTKINERYMSKILLRKSKNINNYENNDNEKDNKDNNKAYTSRQINSTKILEESKYNETPKKIINYQRKSDYKAFTDNNKIRRKIYRFEEGKKVKIIDQ